MAEPNWFNCCKGRGNCPHAAVDEYIHIKDDHGGKVKLTPEEYLLVVRRVKELLLEKLDPKNPGKLLALFKKHP